MYRSSIFSGSKKVADIVFSSRKGSSDKDVNLYNAILETIETSINVAKTKLDLGKLQKDWELEEGEESNIKRRKELLIAIADDLEKDEAYIKSLEEVRKTLEANPGVINMQEQCFDVSLLHFAAGAGYFKFAKLLLELGADKTLKNSLGQTPAERARDFSNRDDIADYIDSFESTLEPRVSELKK